MPRPSPLPCTVADPAGSPAPQCEQSSQAGKRRGNPNLALVARCGARTRAGCPCRAPAIQSKQRCRMHGGRSTGPRTAEGRARIAAARTTHGDYGAEARAFNRHHITFMRRSPLRTFAVLHYRLLPPELAARMNPMAPELDVPPGPVCGISRAEDRAMLQAETAALAPWKHAMALARQARRAAVAAACAAASGAGAVALALAKPLAPERTAGAAAPGSAASVAGTTVARPEAHAPIQPAGIPTAPRKVPASSEALALAEPHAPERTAGAAAPGSAVSVAATAVARPEAHAPIQPVGIPTPPRKTPANSGERVSAEPLAPDRAARGERSIHVSARLAGRAKAHAPERTASAVGTGAAAVPGAAASGRAEPHASIPPALAQGEAGLAPAGSRAESPTQRHAAERLVHRASIARTPARSSTPAKAHAPIHAPTTRTGGGTVPPGRAARRWLRQQKLMRQKQPGGGQP